MTSATAEQRKAHNRAYYLKNKKDFRRRNKEFIERNRKFVTEIKERTPCTDCGVNYPGYIMDFDHLRDKEAGISAMVVQAYSLAALQAEIDKCEVVCSNCHRERTHQRRGS